MDQVQYEGSSKGNEIQETCVCPKCGGQMKITPHGAFCENEECETLPQGKRCGVYK